MQTPNTLNITVGTDVILNVTLEHEGVVLNPALIDNLQANLITGLGRKTPLETSTGIDYVVVNIPWVDGRLPGCYSLEITGSINDLAWSAVGKSIIRYTSNTEIGHSTVDVDGDSYDVVMEVGYYFTDSPIEKVKVTVDDQVGEPYVETSYIRKELKMDFHNMKGETGGQGIQGIQGIPGESAVFDPTTGNISVIEQTTGESITNPMSQHAVSEQVTSDEILATIYGASLTQGKGYVTNTGGFTLSSTYVGAFVPISQYVGKKVRLYLGNGTLIRYAFTLSAPTTRQTTSILCQDCELVSVQNEDYTDDVVPTDAQYLYVYVADGTAVYPSKIEVYGKNTIKAAISMIDEKVDSSLVVSELNLEGAAVQSALTVANGMVAADGKYSLNANYFGAWLNVAKYRGKKILLKAAQTGDFYGLRYAFTLSAPTSAKSTSILCQGTSLVSYYWAHSQEVIEDVIPQDCNYLYVMIHDTNFGYYYPAQIRIVSPINGQVKANTEGIKELEERENVKTARLFGYYFPGNASIEDLNGIDAATIAADGMTLPSLSPVTLPKLTVFDDEEFTLEVNATTSDKILFYSAQTKTGELSSALQTSSHVLFDFANGRVSIYQADSLNTTTGAGTEIEGVDFTSSDGTYILTIGRKQRQVFASIYNKSTMAKVEVTCVESEHSSVNVAQRPAGWMYKYPSFMTLAGTPKYIRFNGYTDGDLYMLFQGDSYTEGYAGFYPDAWSRNACKYFRNSRTCGLSGHKLDDVVQQYHESIKGKVKTEVMVISIGINDMSDLTSDALITAWGERFRTYIEELVADGITPIVNRIWPEGSATSSTATKATKMNNIIRSFGYDGADFGAVEGYSTSSYYTQGHLSVSGNQLSYDIFINELSQYKK